MRPRKITDIKTFLVGGSWRNWLIVKMETDIDGLHGIGEATLEGRSATAETAVHELKRYLMDKDPFEIEKHFQELYRRAFYGGGAVLTSAISGVETAMWDIKGKALGVPVYELLGGKVRDRVKLYANAWYRQGMSPEQMAEAAKAALKLGVQGMKFNPWGAREGIDFYRMDNNILNTGVDAVGAVREAVGPDIDLYIDCNGIFNTVGNAVRAGKAVEEYNITFFEEPIPHEDLDAMAYVRSKLNIPIATGERLFTIFSFQQLLNHGGRRHRAARHGPLRRDAGGAQDRGHRGLALRRVRAAQPQRRGVLRLGGADGGLRPELPDAGALPARAVAVRGVRQPAEGRGRVAGDPGSAGPGRGVQ